MTKLRGSATTTRGASATMQTTLQEERRTSIEEPRTSPGQPMTTSPRLLLEIYRPDLVEILSAAAAPAYRYAQVFEHLLRRPGRPFSEARVLPHGLRTDLDRAGSSVLTVTATREAADGTIKILFTAGDGSHVEAVVMPYGTRLVVCISSQVGCAVGCAFCATGALGFRRNLSAAEIVDQLRAAAALASPGQRLSNVVYMGMGEPLLNLGAVLDSIRILTAPSGVGLGHRALSVSTVGIPAGILRLARAEPQVNLALSLHAADDDTRSLLIPDRFRHPLAQVLEAAWRHFAITGRKLLVEYVLIAGMNDSVDDARRLATLLKGHVVTVNLLPWNPICPDRGERAPSSGQERTDRSLEEPSVPQRGRNARPADRPATGEESAPLATSAIAGRASRGGGPGGEPGGGPSDGPGSKSGVRSGAKPSAEAAREGLLPSPPGAVAAFRATLRKAHIEVVVRRSKGAGIEAACGQLAGAALSYTKEPTPTEAAEHPEIAD